MVFGAICYPMALLISHDDSRHEEQLLHCGRDLLLYGAAGII